MRILLKRYPGSPDLFTVEQGEPDNVYWGYFPKLTAGGLVKIKPSSELVRVSSIVPMGAMLGYTFYNNLNIHQAVEVVSEPEAKLYFKHKLSLQEIVIGKKVLTAEGVIEEVLDITVEDGFPVLIFKESKVLANTCVAFNITLETIESEFRTAFYTRLKEDEPHLYWMMILRRTAQLLNRGWTPEWSEHEPKYCLAAGNKTLQVISPTPFNLDYGIPVFKTMSLAEAAIELLNGNLFKIYAKSHINLSNAGSHSAL